MLVRSEEGLWGNRAAPCGGRVGPAIGAGRPGPAVQGRGLVDRRHARGHGGRGTGRQGRHRVRGALEGQALEGHASPMSTGRPVRWPAPCGPGASGPGTSSWSSSPTGWRPASPSGPSAYLGAVVVPIVHFYGPKEVEYIVGVTSPDVVVTADRFGHSDYLATYSELVEQHTGPLWLVVGDTPVGDLPTAATPFGSMLDARAHHRSGRRRPRRPGASSASPRVPRVTPRVWCTRTARSGSRPASSTGSSPGAGRPRSPARRSGTSSGCSMRS